MKQAVRWGAAGGAVFAVLAVLAVRSDSFWNALSPVFHKSLLYRYAGEYKLDPLLVAAVIHVESKFNPVATSHKGALGLMQLLPTTARELAAELGVEVVNDEELYQPEINIRLGFYYLSKLYREVSGDTVLMLAAYNAGLARAKGWTGRSPASPEEAIRRIGYPETRTFVRRVLEAHQRFKRVQRWKQWLESF